MTKNERLLPVDLLRALVGQDESGQLVWKERTAETHYKSDWQKWNAEQAGKPAFTFRSSWGYLWGRIYRRHYNAHRVIWALHYGKWPDHVIDHINGDCGDNRIENLRDVPHRSNMKNAKRSVSNSSGRTGVTYHSKNKRYIAFIKANYISKHLGSFKTFDEAVAARVAAEGELGFHENHGREASK